jgi:DNA processing protein
METEAAVRAHDYAVTRTLQWLALSLTPGVGAGRGRRLVENFGGVDGLFAASLTALEAAGLPSGAAQSIALGKSLELAATELDHARELGARVIVPGDAEYPRRLLEIYDPPLVLYLKGNAEVIDKSGIAIVGTRRPTPMARALPNASLATLQLAASSCSAGWRAALTPLRTVGP